MKVKAVLLTGLLAAIVAGLFPPWTHTWHGGGGYIEKPAGLAFLFKPPLPDLQLFLAFTLAGRGPMRTLEQFGPDEKVLVVQFSVRVDLARLVIEWFLIAFTVSAALVALRPTAPTLGDVAATR